MAREAKELARQRAELEAQLAAERGNAQGHGYTPTPLATPKPAKVCLSHLDVLEPARSTLILSCMMTVKGLTHT